MARSSAPSVFQHDRFTARAKGFGLARKLHFSDSQGNKIAFLKQKLLKLKDDLRLYADETCTQELLVIKARSMLEISAIYDVSDTPLGQKVGALRRKGLKSILLDEWMLLDGADRQIGLVKEKAGLSATIRRAFPTLVPPTYRFFAGEELAGTASQRSQFFGVTMDVDLSADKDRKLDRRLTVAAIVLLIAIQAGWITPST